MYDPINKLGVALIGVNDPHMKESEIDSVKICNPIKDHFLIEGLSKPDDIVKGVTFVCSVEDAKKVITEIPDLDITGLLTNSAASSKAMALLSLFSLIYVLQFH